MTLITDSPWDEHSRVEAAQQGDLTAFNELILYYQNRAYNLAYQLLRDPASADDATQVAFISAHRALGQFRGGSFRAWLLRIVVNACYDELRRRKRRPTISWDDFRDLDEEANPHLADGGELPEEKLQRAELRKMLENVLDCLPEDQRMVIFLVDRMGLSYNETAETLRIRLGTVKSRLARARAKMRDLLQEQELLPDRYRLKNSV